MSEPRIDQIRTVLYGEDDETVRSAFVDRYRDSLVEFTDEMDRAFDAWRKVDAKVEGSERRAHTSSLVWQVLNNHLVSMKLLLMGHLVQSGNTQRHVLEGIALAILAAGDFDGVLGRYAGDQYSANKAIKTVKRNARRLHLNQEAVKQLERGIKFYDKFSHPTLMTAASAMYFADSSKSLLGGAFDPGKIDAYDKEVRSRVSLAETLCNFIGAVELNMGENGV